MRLYEVVYIVDPALSEDEINAKLDRLQSVLAAPEGAEVIGVDHWGTRQLAYPLQTERAGYYVVSHIMARPDELPEFERLVKLDAQILRYLVVVNEGEPTTGFSVMSERPESARRDDDDDDDDDDEDDDRDGDRDPDDENANPDSPPEFTGGKGRRRRVEGPSIELLNFKDVSTLSKFMTEQGKILPKRTTKVTAAFQRKLGRAIKRARYVALIPYVRDHEV